MVLNHHHYNELQDFVGPHFASFALEDDLPEWGPSAPPLTPDLNLHFPQLSWPPLLSEPFEPSAAAAADDDDAAAGTTMNSRGSRLQGWKSGISRAVEELESGALDAMLCCLPAATATATAPVHDDLDEHAPRTPDQVVAMKAASYFLETDAPAAPDEASNLLTMPAFNSQHDPTASATFSLAQSCPGHNPCDQVVNTHHTSSYEDHAFLMSCPMQMQNVASPPAPITPLQPTQARLMSISAPNAFLPCLDLAAASPPTLHSSRTSRSDFSGNTASHWRPSTASSNSTSSVTQMGSACQHQDNFDCCEMLERVQREAALDLSQSALAPPLVPVDFASINFDFALSHQTMTCTPAGAGSRIHAAPSAEPSAWSCWSQGQHGSVHAQSAEGPEALLAAALPTKTKTLQRPSCAPDKSKEFHPCRHELRKLFQLPIEAARAKVGIPKNAFKKLLLECGFQRWPQRQLVGLQNLMDNTSKDKSLSSAQREARLLRIKLNICAILDGTDCTMFKDLQKASHVYHNRLHQGKSARGRSTQPTGPKIE